MMDPIFCIQLPILAVIALVVAWFVHKTSTERQRGDA